MRNYHNQNVTPDFPGWITRCERQSITSNRLKAKCNSKHTNAHTHTSTHKQTNKQQLTQRSLFLYLMQLTSKLSHGGKPPQSPPPLHRGDIQVPTNRRAKRDLSMKSHLFSSGSVPHSRACGVPEGARLAAFVHFCCR